jgi:hypothetical protein
MPPAGFETAIPASERPQTHALDRAATAIGSLLYINPNSPYSQTNKNDNRTVRTAYIT